MLAGLVLGLGFYGTWIGAVAAIALGAAFAARLLLAPDAPEDPATRSFEKRGLTSSEDAP